MKRSNRLKLFLTSFVPCLAILVMVLLSSEVSADFVQAVNGRQLPASQVKDTSPWREVLRDDVNRRSVIIRETPIPIGELKEVSFAFRCKALATKGWSSHQVAADLENRPKDWFQKNMTESPLNAGGTTGFLLNVPAANHCKQALAALRISTWLSRVDIKNAAAMPYFKSGQVGAEAANRTECYSLNSIYPAVVVNEPLFRLSPVSRPVVNPGSKAPAASPQSRVHRPGSPAPALKKQPQKQGVAARPQPAAPLLQTREQVEAVIEEAFRGKVGLKEVKRQVLGKALSILRAREDDPLGIHLDESMYHLVLTGNPGVGKTTVARIVSDLYAKLGISNGRFVETVGTEYLQKIVGDSSKHMNEKAVEAEGGILFIDEAYSLVQGEGKTSEVGKQALTALLPHMTERKCIVIVAGYKGDMKNFMSANPGLSRRFTNQIDIPDYTDDELMEIFYNKMSASWDWSYEPGVDAEIRSFIDSKRRVGDGKGFGNAGLIENIISYISGSRARLINEENQTELKLIKTEYVKDALTPEHSRQRPVPGSPNRDRIIAAVDEEFAPIIGMDVVKEQVINNVLAIGRDKLDVECGKRNDTPINLHTILTGNPGVGKTTVARILSRLYQKLGVANSNFKEVAGTDLIKGYVGESGEAMKQAATEVTGGTLFLDEAYAMIQGGEVSASIGQQALSALLPFMTDRKCIVIAAGYQKEMADFLKANDGLSRRFANQIDIPDYSTDDLMKIFYKKMESSSRDGWIYGDQVEAQIRSFIDSKRASEVVFGNAGLVGNIISYITDSRARLFNEAADNAREIRNDIVEDALRGK